MAKKTRKNVITITLEMDQRFPVIVVAPDDWGDSIRDVAKRLSEELNNEDDVFMAINNKVVRRMYIDGAIIKSRSIN